jgi:hypothetical protein
MRERVLCPTCKSYKNHGGRGIRIYRRWDDFREFHADMGDPPEGMTLHRKDKNGHYKPENCIWAHGNALDRSDSIMWTHNGETHCRAVWERKLGFKKGVLPSRHYAGWPIEKILTTPTQA